MDVITTREPGGVPTGEEIRRVVLEEITWIFVLRRCCLQPQDVSTLLKSYPGIKKIKLYYVIDILIVL